jgi:hypothetical protein
MFVRMKGASESYQGGYTPTSARSGVPCYFDDNPSAIHRYEATGDQCVASPQNIGAGAPHGVNCSVGELLDDSCLAEPEAYIESTEGATSRNATRGDGYCASTTGARVAAARATARAVRSAAVPSCAVTRLGARPAATHWAK